MLKGDWELPLTPKRPDLVCSQSPPPQWLQVVDCWELGWPEASHPSPPPLPFLLENSGKGLGQKEVRDWSWTAGCKPEWGRVPSARGQSQGDSLSMVGIREP